MTVPDNSPSPPAVALADAFNARDIGAMTAILDDGATARVMGSSFPVEEGRDAIATTSLPYLLDGQEFPLRAEPARVDGTDYLLLRRDPGGELDVAARLTTSSAAIVGIEYLVFAFSREELISLAVRLVIPIPADA